MDNENNTNKDSSVIIGMTDYTMECFSITSLIYLTVVTSVIKVEVGLSEDSILWDHSIWFEIRIYSITTPSTIFESFMNYFLTCL